MRKYDSLLSKPNSYHWIRYWVDIELTLTFVSTPPGGHGSWRQVRKGERVRGSWVFKVKMCYTKILHQWARITSSSKPPLAKINPLVQSSLGQSHLLAGNLLIHSSAIYILTLTIHWSVSYLVAEILDKNHQLARIPAGHSLINNDLIHSLVILFFGPGYQMASYELV